MASRPQRLLLLDPGTQVVLLLAEFGGEVLAEVFVFEDLADFEFGFAFHRVRAAVKDYVANACQKVGVANRVALAAWWGKQAAET